MMRRIDGWSRLLVVPVMLALVACGARLTAEERMDLARSHLSDGDAPTAVIHLKNVLQQDPSNVAARVLLAEASFRTGDYDTAAKEYLRAIDLGAAADDFRLALLESLVRAGGIEQALRHSDPELVGDQPEVRYWRALALIRAGRVEEARATLEALREPPEIHRRAQVGLARLALAERRADDALEILAPLADPMAGDADYWETVAHASVQVGRTDDAIAAFRKAAEVVVDPLGGRQFMFRAGEAEALLSTGQLDEARRVASSLHRRADRHPVPNYLMSRVELQSGNAEQALAYAQAVLAAQPDSSVGHMMAGAASLSLGQTVPAERHLERAIASDPNNLPARKLLAQTRLGLQSPERALQALGTGIADSGDSSAIALAGIASVRAGDPETAIDMLRSQLERNPDDDQLRSMLAVTLMSAGRTDEALAELGQIKAGEGVMRQRADLIGIAAHLQSGDHAAARALAARVAAAQPDDVPIRNTLGALFQAAGLLDESAAWFEESLALDPKNNAAAYNLGRLAANRGEVERAVGLFEGVLEREPDSAVALTALAQIDWARHQRASAIERVQRARAAHPGDGGSRFVLTQYLTAEGRAAEAVTVAREAVGIAPESAPARNALGVVLLETGQPGEALPQFAHAHRINPAEARYLMNSARAHAAQGELGPARGQLVNGLALDPENVVMLAMLVDIERRLGRLDDATKSLLRLEGIVGPSDPRVPLLRGELLLAQERYPEAARAYAEAQRLGVGNRAPVGVFEARRRGGLPEPAAPLLAWLEQQPSDPVVRALLAEHYLSVNDHPAAIGEYEKLIAQAPDNPLFLNNLAWLYGEAGDARAVELARRAHERAPGNPMIADTLGWILHKRGEHAEALELLSGAVAGAPQSGDVRYRYAVVLAETGDAAAASREARAVLADAGAANYHEPAQKLLTRLERGE